MSKKSFVGLKIRVLVVLFHILEIPEQNLFLPLTESGG